MEQCEVKTFLWSGESGLADIWRSWSSSAELSATEKKIKTRQHQHTGCGTSLDREPNLGDLGLLGQFRFPSRFLPVDLVPVDPASELVSQPTTGTRAALSCDGRTNGGLDQTGPDSTRLDWID